MEDKRRSKRAKSLEDGLWECSVCTYGNSPEAFKCEMCDVRKGTSTRKPRLNPQIAAQQQSAQQFNPPPLKKDKSLLSPAANNSAVSSSGNLKRKDENGKKTKTPRLKNVDRTTGTTMEVTVNNVTVFITDYKPKSKRSIKSGDSSQSLLSTSPSEGSSSLNSYSESTHFTHGDDVSDNDLESDSGLSSDTTINGDDQLSFVGKPSHSPGSNSNSSRLSIKSATDTNAAS